jgi:pimeloyl-ACP methyl ester carboxylesterase
MSARLGKKHFRGWKLWLIICFGLFLALFIFLFWPVNAKSLISHPSPVQEYSQAELQIQSLQMQEASDHNPVCQTQFMSHGKKTVRVIVFIHGYTNCPCQFVELGKLFYQKGYNVLIVPLPRHGLADRMTEELAQLKAEELVTYADGVVDVAQGLGEHVTVAGISGGGVVTGWIAQNRPDADLAVLISPAFGYAQVSPDLTLPASKVYSLLPNSFEWWDEELKENNPPSHAYPRYSTRALAQLLRLSLVVQAQAREEEPMASEILVVTNANDQSVSMPLIRKTVELWQEHRGSDLQTYEFPAALRLDHDLIDPSHPDERIDIVYPQLIDLITQ